MAFHSLVNESEIHEKKAPLLLATWVNRGTITEYLQIVFFVNFNNLIFISNDTKKVTKYKVHVSISCYNTKDMI